MSTAAPTSLGDMPIGPPGTSGAAFELRSAARADATVQVNGWDIQVRRGLKLVVARGGTATDPQTAVDDAVVHAQRGLDLMAVGGANDAAIQRWEDLHVCWWPNGAGTVLQVRTSHTMTMTVGDVTIETTREDGTVGTPTEPTGPLVHPSFRYYRLAQTTDDLFDAYRNTFLALEAILSDLAPQTKGEGERAWVERALREADRLVPFAPLLPGATDPVADMRRVLWDETRSPMSHAKAGRTVLTPADPAQRRPVLDALRLGGHLYLQLAEAQLGLRRKGGFVTSFAFTAMFSALLDAPSSTACISDDDAGIDLAQTVVNPNGGRVVWATGSEPTDTTRPFTTSRTWLVDRAALDQLDVIRRVVQAKDGAPLLANRLEGDLAVGPDLAEVRLGFTYRGRSAGSPRDDYGA